MPPIRLRYVLMAGLSVSAVSWVVPRARAAWEAHELGSTFGDYSVCMAGPSGAQLLRDDEAAFRRLVRRRIVSASPAETPFARCAAGAGKISGSEAILRAHRLPAGRFSEHGTDPAAKANLDVLALGLEPLRVKVRAAWPFVKGNYTSLVRPSLSAREAVHPVMPPEPGVGRGLPPTTALVKTAWESRDFEFAALGLGAQRAVFQSADGGVTFRVVADPAGGELTRCTGRDATRGFELGTASDASLLVTAVVADQEPRASVAVQGEHALISAACDDQALVLAAHREGTSEADVVICRAERRCERVALPQVPPFGPLSATSFDVTRSAGATIVAVSQGGIVRVISSRDDGKTWTPPTVAYDAGELSPALAQKEPPFRLLSFGQRVLLYGTATRSQPAYALLASDDQGASFRALGDGPTAPSARVASAKPR